MQLNLDRNGLRVSAWTLNLLEYMEMQREFSPSSVAWMWWGFSSIWFCGSRGQLGWVATYCSAFPNTNSGNTKLWIRFFVVSHGAWTVCMMDSTHSSINTINHFLVTLHSLLGNRYKGASWQRSEEIGAGTKRSFALNEQAGMESRCVIIVGQLASHRTVLTCTGISTATAGMTDPSLWRNSSMNECQQETCVTRLSGLFIFFATIDCFHGDPGLCTWWLYYKFTG